MFCSHSLTRLSCVAILGTILGPVPVNAHEPQSSLQKLSTAAVKDDQQESTSFNQLKDNRQQSGPFDQLKETRQRSRKSILHVILDELFGRIKRPPATPLTTRGKICPIAPGLLEKENRIFSDRPLFVWQGEVDTIKVYDDETDQILWQGSIAANATTARYEGTPLKPGKYYIWSLERDNQVLTRHFFELMSTEEREHLLHEHHVTNLSQSSSRSLENADNFAALGLWSDVLNALNLEQQPGIDVKLAALNQDLCSDDSLVEASQS